ncbi:MAG: sigma-70 family RNA polymerase sigma factor [Vicinamibacterales bacterium]
MLFGRRRRDDPPPPEADRFAAEALEHLDRLYGTALRLTRDADAAQDLVQETYLKALRARDRFASGTNLKAWLFTILHNTERNRRRDRARARVEYDSDLVDEAGALDGVSLASTVESPETLLLRGTIDADVQAALDALPDTYRQAVWLRDVEELTYQEIAGVLAVPIGTVMSRISRGRKQLYDRLAAARTTQPTPADGV